MPLNWKLTLAYDGTDYRGWQVQPELPTIQGELAAAVERITGERVLPQGSGRTDAGVHALGQVASFVLKAPIPAENLHRALNRTLPAAIRVLGAESMPEDFHARHSARSKWYEYRIFRGEVCPPWTARYVYALHWPLDVEAMRRAAAAFVGEHDFRSFAASDPDVAARGSEDAEESHVRTIFASGWAEEDDLLIYRVHGNGFLHHMVRNLVGTMIGVGRRQFDAEDMPGLLALRDRSAAGATAPARGLFLYSVCY
ncbi:MULTISPECIES: tRNA pseudouridine(38-40) synthase TruA [Acidobacterium]|uniref:tRNA pseudouridine synthase A n=1 Tax=Acidobacterium capsulatum (strain ATCC 51196 / DSM 11244 / BCRC 80197 / JCM 7670 / NBRC 15755 / NCIMB 13165 / 161) TaxID=240015 RepID=C1F1S9_ACIC5|nr:tRNA pseudouridine synthase A [Acidobacterium capsulatum ATCC 51196]